MAPLLPLLFTLPLVPLFGYCAYRWGQGTAKQSNAAAFRAGWGAGYSRGWVSHKRGHRHYTPWLNPADELALAQDEQEYNSDRHEL